MKLTKLPPTRPNVSIEMTPEEQDLLFTLVGNLIGDGPIRNLTSDIWAALESVGAKEVPIKDNKTLVLLWG